MASSKSHSGFEPCSAPEERDTEKEHHHGRAETQDDNDNDRDLKADQLRFKRSSKQLDPRWNPQKTSTWPSPPVKIELQGNAAAETPKDPKPKHGSEEVSEDDECLASCDKKQDNATFELAFSKLPMEENGMPPD